MQERGYVLAKDIKHHAPHYGQIVRAAFRDGHIGLLFKPHLRSRKRQEFVPILRPERFEMPWMPRAACGVDGWQHWHYAVSREERSRLADAMHSTMRERGMILLPIRLDGQTDRDPFLWMLNGDVWSDGGLWQWRRKEDKLEKVGPDGKIFMRYNIGLDGRQALRDLRRGDFAQGRSATRTIALMPR